MLRRYKLKNYNFRLVLWILVLSAIGVILVGSAMKSLQMRQLAGVIGGVVLMVIVSLMDFSWILNFYWVIYGANIVLLLLLIPLGSEQLGATRWISIGGFQFQPTELSKIFLILFFADYFFKTDFRLWVLTLKAFDATEYGGAPMLGLKGLVVKTHGNATAKEVKNTLFQCLTFKEQRIGDKMKQLFVEEKENVQKG